MVGRGAREKTACSVNHSNAGTSYDFQQLIVAVTGRFLAPRLDVAKRNELRGVPVRAGG